MKKSLALLCALCLLGTFVLAACTPNPNIEDSSDTSDVLETEETTDALDTTAAETTAPDESDSESVSESETTEPEETWPLETSAPEVVSVVEGEVRVILYSESLLRVEVAKDDQFEDRPTFSVTGRDSFDGIAPEHLIRTEEDGVISLKTPRFTATIKKNAQDAADVSIYDVDGNSIWEQTDFTTNETYLPEPYETPYIWGFNDVRRLIKAENPYTPNGEENNGWELTMNARDYYLFVPMGDAAQLRYDFNKLTGECEMTPLKTLGLWYSRYAGLSDQQFYDLINEYYDRGFPLDVLVVDVDWKASVSGTGYEVNQEFFPDFEEFFATANEMGVLTILNDHVRDYSGSMLDTDQLNYFNENLTYKMEQGMNAWWYDRNWNYHFNSPFRGYDGDLLGQDYYYSVMKDFNGNNRTWMLSNVYWINASDIKVRPHVSSHRYSLQWTGDITCSAQSLQLELEHAVFAGAAAAMPYVLSDIGGHIGKPNEDLYIRWTQYGCLSSIMRYHANGHDRSPWVAGTEELAEPIAREYINMRYRLMPLYYSLARANYDTGMPIMKRLDFQYAQYEEARANDQYLLGDNILVAPITTAFSETLAIFPVEWLEANDGSHGYDAEYYIGKTLAGAPRATRVETAIDYNWGKGAPEGVMVDNYSVRWSTTLTNKSDYPICLATLSDDGIRVKVDGEWIINDWNASDSALNINKEFLIQPGQTCDLVVEYYEDAGDARASLYYFSLPADGSAHRDYRDVFIPDGVWMDVWSGQTYTGPRTVSVGHTEYTSPIFVKLGSFTVLAKNHQNLATSDWKELALDVYPGAGSFNYEFYEDDGTTEDYKNNVCRRTAMSMVTEGKTTTMNVGAAVGSYTTDFTERTYVLRVHEYDGYTVSDIKVNGQSVNFTRIEQADAYTENGGSPFAFEGASCDTDVATITFTAAVNAASEIVISYN